MCVDCKENCGWVSNECLCVYTPLINITKSDIPAAISMADSVMESTLGDCYEQFCKEEGGIKEENIFKRYYSWLVYKYWFLLYGHGKATREGFVAKRSDDFSEFSNVANSTSKSLSLEYKIILEELESKFLKLLESKYPQCIKCETIENKCNKCDCNPCSCSHDYEMDYSAL